VRSRASSGAECSEQGRGLPFTYNNLQTSSGEEIIIKFRNPAAASMCVTALSMCVAALPMPALAGGHGGGGGGGHSHGPPHPPPPLILDSGAAGRAVSSNCFKPVVDAHGTVVAYRRIRACR
jgi:hypothetical protein